MKLFVRDRKEKAFLGNEPLQNATVSRKCDLHRVIVDRFGMCAFCEKDKQRNLDYLSVRK